MTDELHMRAALALSRRGLGSTWPNPSVGCVLMRDGRVVGRGTHDELLENCATYQEIVTSQLTTQVAA